KAILCRLINRWLKISPLEIILLRVSMMELGAGKKRTSIQLNLATISQIRMNAIGDAICTTLSLGEFSINTCLTYRSSGPPCNQRLHVAPALSAFRPLLPHSGSKLVAETVLGASLSNLVRRDLRSVGSRIDSRRCRCYASLN